MIKENSSNPRHT